MVSQLILHRLAFDVAACLAECAVNVLTSKAAKDVVFLPHLLSFWDVTALWGNVLDMESLSAEPLIDYLNFK